VRVIKSLEFRTVKSLVLRDVDLTDTTVGKLKEIVKERIQTVPGFKPYLNGNQDTLKIYVSAQGTKSSNLVLNVGQDDEFTLSDEGRKLVECGVGHETEISFFNWEAYQAYKTHPDVVKW
ncbi:hypothetical protein M427DRAFT_92626, partial [Gonapodya prolifera JEL478]